MTEIKKLIFLIIVLCVVSGSSVYGGYIITTIAGNGSVGYSGDEGNAASAKLNSPYGVAVDAFGEVYIADTYNNRIRVIDTSGMISTLAGIGTSGYSGDGSNAASAQLNAPWGIAVDVSGNAYIASFYYDRIRKIDASGIISAFAGTGKEGYSGDGGIAASAQLTSPHGVAVDDLDNVYIADYGNNRIRKVNASGLKTTISTLAGTGKAGYSGDGGRADLSQLNSPEGVAVDNAGNVYIADYGNNRIRKVDPSGKISTLAGTGKEGYSGDGGRADLAQLNGPRGVAVDSSGNVYIADYGNNRLRKVDPSGTITTLAGTGARGYSGDGGNPASAKLNGPRGVAVDASGNVYFADNGNHCIRKIYLIQTGIISGRVTKQLDETKGIPGTLIEALRSGVARSKARSDIKGNYSLRIGTGTYDIKASLPGYSAQVKNKYRVANGSTVTVSFSLAERYRGVIAGRVMKHDGKTAIPKAFIEILRNGITQLSDTTDDRGHYSITIETGTYDIRASMDGFQAETETGYNVSNGSTITINYALGTISYNITTIAGDGIAGYSGDGGSATSAKFKFSYGVAVDTAGNVYIADTHNNRIRKVDTQGQMSTFAGKGTIGFSGDGGQAAEAQITSPRGVAVDTAGNVYISDEGNHRIRKVNAQGIISTVADTAIWGDMEAGFKIPFQRTSPRGLAVDDFGNIYFADFGNHRVRKINTLGIISTIAGSAAAGYSGDGGSAIAAQLDGPEAVAVDASGNVYVADITCSRVRKITVLGIITTIAGNGAEGYSGDGVKAVLSKVYWPSGVAVDVSGNIYIADYGNNRIRRVNSSGIISTIAGNGSYGYSGDGGSAPSAQLNGPRGLTVDVSGNVYFVDYGNNRIRKVNLLKQEQGPKAK